MYFEIILDDDIHFKMLSFFSELHFLCLIQSLAWGLWFYLFISLRVYFTYIIWFSNGWLARGVVKKGIVPRARVKLSTPLNSAMRNKIDEGANRNRICFLAFACIWKDNDISFKVSAFRLFLRLEFYSSSLLIGSIGAV